MLFRLQFFSSLQDTLPCEKSIKAHILIAVLAVDVI
jgi:hypothetical protein